MRALASFAELADPSDRWIRLACGALFGVYLAFAGLLLASAKDGLDPAGTPLGYDFSAFHTAARLAVAGDAPAAYDDGAMTAAERAAFPGSMRHIPWNYPPSFLLPLLPLALLPYGWAWIAWTGTMVGAHAVAGRALWPAKAFWPLILAPAAAINLLLGQNGLLSAILIGTGIALLPRRPVLAGLALGLLSYKPHLAVLAPIALLAGREWRALMGAAASAIGLAGLSIAVLGLAPWLAFLHKAGDAGGFVASSFSGWQAVPSTLVMVKDLRGGDLPAVLAQAVVAVIALAAMVRIWMAPGARRWRGAVLAVAALLATPYIRIYDFALLALPIAAFASEPARARAWEWMVLAALWLLPLLLLVVGNAVPLGPPILALAMILIMRRAAEARLAS